LTGQTANESAIASVTALAHPGAQPAAAAAAVARLGGHLECRPGEGGPDHASAPAHR